MSCTRLSTIGYAACAGLLKRMNGSGIQAKNTTWTESDLKDVLAWRLAIASKTNSERTLQMLQFDGFSNTSDEPEVLTALKGTKHTGSLPTPSGVTYLESSVHDYRNLQIYENETLQHIPFFENKTFWMTKNADGTFKGFTLQIGLNYGMPPEDKTTSFPVYMYYRNYDEFKNVYVFKMEDFNLSDLQSFTPAAINVDLVTAYATGGEIIYDVTIPGTDPKEGLIGLDAVTDHEVLVSDGAPIVVATIVDDTGFRYAVTFKADSSGIPADLLAVEKTKIIVHQDDGTYVEYLSPVFTFNGTGS